MSGLTGRTVLITGGGSGVGADMAREFAAQGADVWIGGRRVEALKEVAKGTDIRVHRLDVTDPASVAAFFDAAPSPEIVIANAGQAMGTPFARTEMKDWDRLIAVNLTGAFLTMREAIRRMDPKWGRIIATASIAGIKGLAYAAPYVASKHGVVGLVRSLSLETAKTGITVNAICPGYLETEMTDRSISDIAQASGKSAEEARALLARVNVHKRLIRAGEVTSVALWLASDGASSVNGQAIAVSGGDL